MSDVIKIHKYEDGNEAVVVKFGFGKIGIGLDDNCERKDKEIDQ